MSKKMLVTELAKLVAKRFLPLAMMLFAIMIGFSILNILSIPWYTMLLYSSAMALLLELMMIGIAFLIVNKI